MTLGRETTRTTPTTGDLVRERGIVLQWFEEKSPVGAGTWRQFGGGKPTPTGGYHQSSPRPHRIPLTERIDIRALQARLQPTGLDGAAADVRLQPDAGVSSRRSANVHSRLARNRLTVTGGTATMYASTLPTSNARTKRTTNTVVNSAPSAAKPRKDARAGRVPGIERPAAVEDVAVEGPRGERDRRRDGVRYRDGEQESVDDEAEERVGDADDEEAGELAHREIILDDPVGHFRPPRKCANCEKTKG